MTHREISTLPPYDVTVHTWCKTLWISHPRLCLGVRDAHGVIVCMCKKQNSDRATFVNIYSLQLSCVYPCRVAPQQGRTADRTETMREKNLHNWTCTVASLRPVWPLIFGFLQSVNIQYNVYSHSELPKEDRLCENCWQWGKFQHTDTHTHTRMTQWDPCCPAGRLQGELMCSTLHPEMPPG